MSAWFHSEVIGNAATGQPVYIPKDVENVISVGLVPDGGASGKVQYTLSTVAKVNAGTATWRDWPGGVVAVTTDDVLVGPVTAVRGVSAVGNVTIEVVG